MKILQKILITLGIIGSVSLCSIGSIAGASSVFNASSEACNQSGSSLCNDINGTDKNSILGIINTVINVLMYVLAGISVLMIVIAGIQFATSSGSSDKVESAKKTITYAVIGLVVAICGYAIVNFVIGLFA